MQTFKRYVEEVELLQEKLIIVGNGGNYGNVIFLAGGAGCHAKGTEVLMYDGSYKKVEKIKINDMIMGIDSLPKRVNELHSGKEKMLEVKSNKGDSYICNENHIHTFYCNTNKCGFKRGEYYNLTFAEYEKTRESVKKVLKIYKSPAIEFDIDNYTFEMDPWIIGFWIGDGTRGTCQMTIQKESPIIEHIKEKYTGDKFSFNELKTTKPNCGPYSLTTKCGSKNPFFRYIKKYCTVKNEKRIPKELLLSSIENRKKLLAGLIDSDGWNATGYYEICTKWENLKNDIEFLCGSLGYRTRTKIKKVPWNGELREYHVISISGDFTDLPVVLEYKKINSKKNKNPLNMGFTITPLEEDDFYGFSLDSEDERFILKNWIVNHNSGKGFSIDKFIDSSKFKVRDVDEWKRLSMKMNKYNKLSVQSILDKDAAKNKPKISPKNKANIEKYITNKNLDLKDLDLRNPNHVFALHILVDSLDIKDKTLANMLQNSQEQAAKGILPNIIFDITAKSTSSVEKISVDLVKSGYDPKHINMIWILTNYEVAVAQNKGRERVVPHDILLQTHEGAANTMWKVVNGATMKDVNGGYYVILGGEKNSISYTENDLQAKNKKELMKKSKNINNSKQYGILKTKKNKGEILKTGGVLGGKKKKVVIKDFKYIQLKKPGKPVEGKLKLQIELLKWIRLNIPKTSNTKHMWD